jgi:hypothetical protein
MRLTNAFRLVSLSIIDSNFEESDSVSKVNVRLSPAVPNFSPFA